MKCFMIVCKNKFLDRRSNMIPMHCNTNVVHTKLKTKTMSLKKRVTIIIFSRKYIDTREATFLQWLWHNPTMKSVYLHVFALTVILLKYPMIYQQNDRKRERERQSTSLNIAQYLLVHINWDLIYVRWLKCDQPFVHLGLKSSSGKPGAFNINIFHTDLSLSR